MGFQNLKFVVGAGLSLLVVAGGVNPAFSESGVEMAGNHRTHTEVTHHTITGTIKSIVGEVVTLSLEQGKGQADKTETVRISQRTLKSMGLVPGMRIAAVVRGGAILADEVRVLPQVAVVRTETTRVVTTKQAETEGQHRSVVTPPTRTQTEQVEIRRQQEVRETQQQRPIVPPAPRRTESVEIRRQSEVRETPVVLPAPVPTRPVRGLW